MRILLVTALDGGGVVDGSRSRAEELWGDSKFASGAVVGSGLTEEGFSLRREPFSYLHCGCTRSFNPCSLRPDPSTACLPRGFSGLRTPGTGALGRSLRRGSERFLSAQAPRTRAHTHSRAEPDRPPRRRSQRPPALSIPGPARLGPPWRCWRAGSRAPCSGTAS